MPYRPTNMSPDNVAIVRGQDIIFHCLIDKYDRIDRVKLTLYNTNNEENSAYIELELDENETIISTSEGLTWDEGNSSKLPFIANDYEVSVFAIGIKVEDSAFFTEDTTQISYTLELSNKNLFENFVLEGNFLEAIPAPDLQTVKISLPATPLINDNQRIFNLQKKDFDFVKENEYFYNINKIKGIEAIDKDPSFGSDNVDLWTRVYLDYPFDNTLAQQGRNLQLEIANGITYDIIEISSTLSNGMPNVYVQFPRDFREQLKPFVGTVVNIYNKSIDIRTDFDFLTEYTFKKMPFSGQAGISSFSYASQKTNGKPVLGVTCLFDNTNENALELINSFYFFYRDIPLGPLIPNDKFVEMHNARYPSYDISESVFNADYYFQNAIFNISSINTSSIIVGVPAPAEDLINKNFYFQIKSNSVISPERTFTLIDKETISITEELNALTTQIYSGSLTGEQNTIEYSQWSLSDANGVVIDETPRAYAKIENYQYNFFKPNSTYRLKLKVHDKRNIDWKAEKEIKTGDMTYNETYNEATLDEKAIKISLPTGTKATSYIINRLEMKPKNNSVNNDSFWLKEYIIESTQDYDIINKITLKEVGSLCSIVKDYSAGQGKYYQYEIIPIGIENPVIYCTNIVDTFDWYEINLFGTKSYYKNTDKHQYEVDENNLWTFELDAVANQITFNATNTPIDASGSRYPKITGSHKNYLSGSGSMYLGTLDENDFYSRDNDAELMRFYKFANNGAVKFLKLKNGMVVPVSITLKNGNNLDNLTGNPTKINFDWVQVDDINSSLIKEEIEILSTENSSSNEDEMSEEVSA